MSRRRLDRSEGGIEAAIPERAVKLACASPQSVMFVIYRDVGPLGGSSPEAGWLGIGLITVRGVDPLIRQVVARL